MMLGSGEPLSVGHSDTRRLWADGAGLCSPGLWAPEQRTPAIGVAKRLNEAFQYELAQWDKSLTGGIARILGGLAAGRLNADPFPPESTVRLRDFARDITRHAACLPLPGREARKQPIDVLLVGSVLNALGDPDHEIMSTYAVGVPLGVGTELPRTPAVFPEKTKWALAEQAEWGGDSVEARNFTGSRRANYSSAVGFRKEVEAQLREQATRGEVVIMPEKDAEAKYGSKLTIASLSALEKGLDDDGLLEVRILLDGTNGVNVNRYIKVRDGSFFPLSADARAAMRRQKKTGRPHWGTTVDVKGAHRLIMIRDEDWPYVACQLEEGGDVFINVVGTFGISSAAYWWSRLAAAIHRAGLHIVTSGLPLWVLLFADDWDLTAGGPTYARAILTFIWWLVVVNVPLSWKKSRGGFSYTWVGYEKCVREWTLGISASRAEWAIGWMSRVLTAGEVEIPELRGALGRLVFVYGALTYDKPCLGPLFAFLSRRQRGGKKKLPLFVKIVLTWLRDRLKARRVQKVLERTSLNRSVLRVDAKAEGLAVAVGGWAPHYEADGTISIGKSRWFSVELTERDAPWAFIKGVPANTISTLELLATTLGLVLLAPTELQTPGVAGGVTVTGFTDSLVSASVVTRGMTTSFPLCVVAMELAAQLEARSAELLLEWVPREVNAEADRLADGDSRGFLPEHQVKAAFGQVRWLVLDRLMSAGVAFQRESQRIRQRTGTGNQNGQRRKVRKLAGEGFKDREPW